MSNPRGQRRIAPDDVRGIVVPGNRVRGRTWRQGKFTRARNWGSGKGRDGVHGEAPDERLRLVELEPGLRPKIVQRPGHPRLARVCGWIAIGSVALMWLVAVLVLLSRLLFGSEGPAWPALWGVAFAVGFIGSHLFGMASEGLSGSRDPLGLWAVGAFWISILGWVPLGMALAGFSFLG